MTRHTHLGREIKKNNSRRVFKYKELFVSRQRHTTHSIWTVTVCACVCVLKTLRTQTENYERMIRVELRKQIERRVKTCTWIRKQSAGSGLISSMVLFSWILMTLPKSSRKTKSLVAFLLYLQSCSSALLQKISQISLPILLVRSYSVVHSAVDLLILSQIILKYNNIVWMHARTFNSIYIVVVTRDINENNRVFREYQVMKI